MEEIIGFEFFYNKFKLKIKKLFLILQKKLAANSWGDQWGENGYFRIERNDDETEFGRHVYSGWGNRPGFNFYYLKNFFLNFQI